MIPSGTSAPGAQALEPPYDVHKAALAVLDAFPPASAPSLRFALKVARAAVGLRAAENALDHHLVVGEFVAIERQARDFWRRELDEAIAQLGGARP